MRIEIIDDGVGAFSAFNKLKYTLPGDYSLQILDEHFPLGNLSGSELFSVAKSALQRAISRKAEAVVFSSVALSMVAAKILAASAEVLVYGCEAPILHAGTYTASQVLVVGDCFVAQAAGHFPNVIALCLSEFSELAESGCDERRMVEYIAQNVEPYYGSFDCIALGCSSMNLYKHCFSRVFPNARIFDGLDGVARKLRKKFHGKCCGKNERGKANFERKNQCNESSVTVFGEKMQDLSQKYKFFIEEFQITY